MKPDQKSFRSQVTFGPGDYRLSPSFRGLVDNPKLCKLFDAVKELSDFAYDQSVYEAAHHLEIAMNAILVHKDRLDRGVLQFKTRRNLAKERQAQVKNLLELRAKMIEKIVANAQNEPAMHLDNPKR